MNDLIKGILPLIGTALGGPLGGIATEFIASKLGVTDATKETITASMQSMLGSPEKTVELKQIEADLKVHLATLGYDSIEKIEAINASVVVEVNKTMQDETKSDHWPSYSWRPFIGFQFGLYISSLWLLPLFHIVPVIMNADMVLAIGGILGVASWFRGKAQADVANPIIKG